MQPPTDSSNHPVGEDDSREGRLALAALTDALGDPDTDLDALLSVLTQRVRAVVGSLLSLRLTVIVANHRFTVVGPAVPAGAEVASSVLIPLGPSERTGAARAELVLTASRSGAFVDFAADAAHQLGIDLDAVDFDAHLVDSEIEPADGEGVHPGATSESLQNLSTVNQAVGICLDHGHSVTSAHRAMSDRAHREGIPVVVVAQRIIDGRAPPDQLAVE